MHKPSRRIVQIIAALGINSYFIGFLEGRIYQGSLKKFCVPGLNCSSCPGAWGACPIGMLQAGVAGMLSFPTTLLIIGFILIAGISLGRLVCGWFCPFGLIQELIYKLPGPKLEPDRLKSLAYLKYMVLIIFVILLPALGIWGLSSMAFCRYICPVEVLEATLPLTIVKPALMSMVSLGLVLKTVFLLALLILAIVISKPFCRFICPLGAIYSVFNPISLYRLQLDTHKCNGCGSCQEKCPVNIAVFEAPNHPECIRCNECLPCPAEALDIKRYRKPAASKIEL